MKTTVTINGITQTIELTKEQMELIEAEKFGRVSKNRIFYYLGVHNKIFNTCDDRGDYVNNLFETGNYFLTEEAAEREAKITSLRRRMIRFSDEHSGDGKWYGKKKHWYIIYRNSLNKLELSHTSEFREFEKVYFNSEEAAKLAIEKFKDELMELV